MVLSSGDLCLRDANGYSVQFVKQESERDAEGWWEAEPASRGRSPARFRGGIPEQMAPSLRLG